MVTAGEIIKRSRQTAQKTGVSTWTALKQDKDVKAARRKTSNISKQKMIVTKVTNSTPTKAEQRTSKQNNTIAGTSTQVGTAWNKIRDQYNNSNWFNKLYQKVDYGLFGFLPAGISRDLVKAADNEIKTEDTLILANTNRNLNKAKIIEDYSNKDFIENIPFVGDYFYPEEEKIYQERQQQDLNKEILTEQASSLGGGYTDIPLLDDNNSNFDWKTGLTFGAVALGAIFVLGAMNK